MNLVCGVIDFPAWPAPAALHVLLLDAAKQDADIVAGLALVQQLTEHLDPRTTVFCVSLDADDLHLSPTLTMPRSTLPVTTVPRPEMENTSSTGIRNGLSISRLGSGM